MNLQRFKVFRKWGKAKVYIEKLGKSEIAQNQPLISPFPQAHTIQVLLLERWFKIHQVQTQVFSLLELSQATIVLQHHRDFSSKLDRIKRHWVIFLAANYNNLSENCWGSMLFTISTEKHPHIKLLTNIAKCACVVWSKVAIRDAVLWRNIHSNSILLLP